MCNGTHAEELILMSDLNPGPLNQYASVKLPARIGWEECMCIYVSGGGGGGEERFNI